MNIQCPNCNSIVNEVAKFCQECGEKLPLTEMGSKKDHQQSMSLNGTEQSEIVETNEKKQDRYLGPFVDMEFVLIKGGTFEMGDTFNEGHSAEQPVHEVQLNDFYLATTPVTQGQWERLMNDNPSDFEKGDDYPVEKVSWDDAQEFIEKLNNLTGIAFRLPTEAEWEYAAREKGKKVRFGNGKDIADPREINFDSGESSKEDYSVSFISRGCTTPVDKFKPNALGLYDMSGNISEWCQDIYDDKAYEHHQDIDPICQGNGDRRVIRGGSWNDNPFEVRCAHRGCFDTDERIDDVGFRLARSVE